MTLSAIPQREVKQGNDSTTVFSFSFVINRAADLVVTVTDSLGVETVINEGTSTTEYSLSVASYPGNGSITYPATLGTELPTGDSIALERIVDLDQDTDLVNQGAWKPEEVEAAFAYSRMADQQIDDKTERSLKLPVSVDTTSISVDVPVPSALKTFRWNAAANALEETDDPGVSATAAAASAAAALVSETNAAASETNASTSETNAASSETTASSAAATAVAAAAGIKRKDNCINATTANVTLSGEQTIDGVLTATSRILVKDQTAPAENGIYVTASGAWARSTDLDDWAEVPNATVAVEQGTLNADKNFQVISDSGGTIGVTAMTWVAVGGGDLVSSNNLSDVSSAPTALSNLGIDGSSGNIATGDIADNAVTPPKVSGTVNAQTGTTYTLVLTDAFKTVTCSNAAAVTLTVPTNASVAFGTGDRVDLVGIGTGLLTVTGDTGVTVNGVSAGSGTFTAQYSAASLLKTATDTWLLIGDHGGVA